MKIAKLLKIFLRSFGARKEPFVYVAIGDSATEGVGASHPERSYTGILFKSIQKYNNTASYTNFGKSGAPVKEVIETQMEKTIERHPHVVTISVGANDLRLRTLPGIFETRLRYLIKSLKSATKATIIINTVPDFSHTPKIPPYLKHASRFAIKHFNSIIVRVAKEEKIYCVDLFEQGAYFSKHYPEAISEDGFHPSDFGYALWANEMLGQIKHLLRPQLPHFS